VDASGLLTITGGKWTIYRQMAEECVDRAIALGRLPRRPCTTKSLHIHGYLEDAGSLAGLEVYGSDAEAVRALAQNPALAVQLHPDLPYISAEVVWAARQEMARNVEDVLARHTRALFLDAAAAMEMAEPVARLLAAELGRNEAWVSAQVSDFCALARQYRLA
jgi:glycerol-3-phosphate dehydrogenase